MFVFSHHFIAAVSGKFQFFEDIYCEVDMPAGTL